MYLFYQKGFNLSIYYSEILIDSNKKRYEDFNIVKYGKTKDLSILTDPLFNRKYKITVGHLAQEGNHRSCTFVH